MSAKRDVDPLAAEQRAIAARRERLEARRARLADPKARARGVSVEGIESQIATKKALKQAEKEREAAIARDMEAAAAASEAYEQAAARQARAEAAAVRRQQEKQQALRDARVRAEREKAREATATSLEFAGEDLGKGERARRQASQQRGWIRTQLREREARKAEESQALQREDEELQRFTAVAERLERESHAATRARAARVASVNAEHAARKREQEARERELSALADMDEIEGNLRGAFLTEDKAAARSAVDPARHIPYAFKGFTAEERQRILDEQARQIEGRKARMAEQAEQERREHEQGLEVQRMLARQERLAREQELASKRREKEGHVRMAAEKAGKDAALKKELATNEVSDDFFAQFGTSTR